MRPARHLAVLCASLAVCMLAVGAAHADDPKFDFKKKDEVSDVVWKASAQVGAGGAYGNAQTITVTGGLLLSRTDGANKVSFDAGGLYTQSWVRTATAVDNPVAGTMPPKGDGVLDKDEQTVKRDSTPAVGNWLARLRYDRFLTDHNSGYLTVFAGQDFAAKKSLLSGGQLGYSRLLLKSEMHEMAAELGYDLSYTRFDTDGVDPILMHSARLFLGYLFTLSKETAINASVEAFINCNPIMIGPKLFKPGSAEPQDPNTSKGFGEASRVVGKLGLTTVIYKNVSFKFGLTIKYDNAPAPLAALPAGITTLGPGVELLRADKLDVLGDAGLIVSFL